MAPLAIASDGSLLLNIAHASGPTDPRKLLERALAEGRAVFIGVTCPVTQQAVAKRWLDEAAAEMVGTIWGKRQRRRRAVARRIRRTPS
jgi:hypothetical protein